MCYERCWRWAKEHLKITVPSAVLIFAATYIVMLAVNAGEAGAAWVQAVGSVGAILAAVWVSERGHQRDRERAETEAHEERSRLIGLAERAVFEAGISVDRLSDDMLSLLDLSITRVKLGRIEQAAEILRGLLLQPLPQLVAADVFAVLAHIAELTAEVGSWRPMQVPSGWKQIIMNHSKAVNRHYSSILAIYEMHGRSVGIGVFK